MSWIRLDDKFPRHPKVAQLTDREFRIHIEVVCWCAEYQTDGRVNKGTFRAVAGLNERVAKRFVLLGIWDENDRERIVHDWRVYNADTLEERVIAYLESHPGASANEVVRKVGGKRALVLSLYKTLTGSPQVPDQYPDGTDPGSPEGQKQAEVVPEGGTNAGALPLPHPSAPNGAAAEDQEGSSLEVNELRDVGNVIQFSAAAPQPRATHSEVESITASLRGSDVNTIRVVEPLAMLIPAEQFEKAYKKLKRRKNVEDESALFITLLKAEVKEQARARAHAALNAPRPEAPVPASKRAKEDPKGFIAEKIPELAAEPDASFDEWLGRFLGTFVADESEHDALRDFAHAARNGERGAA